MSFKDNYYKPLPQNILLAINQVEQTLTLTTLNAGDGDNAIHVSNGRVGWSTSYIIHAGDGDDSVEFDSGYSGGDSPRHYDGIFIDGGAGNDSITVSGRNITDDILTGGTGLNFLSGNGGNDRYILSAQDGRDWINLPMVHYVPSEGHSEWLDTVYPKVTPTVELPVGITDEMISTTFSQAVEGGYARSALNIAWNGQIHASILLKDTGHSDAMVVFADGSEVKLDDLIAKTTVADNAGYYSGNVRVAISTSAAVNLVGQGDKNVFAVQGDGITHVTTGAGNNVLQDFNPNSTCVLSLTAGSETWVDYFHDYHYPTVANLQIDGSAQASVYLPFMPWSYNSSLLRDGQDLVLVCSDSTQPLRFSFTDWFSEASPHQVIFYNYIGNDRGYSLQKLVDHFAIQSGGTIQDGSSMAFGWFELYNSGALVNDLNESGYLSLGTDWQLPLTRVMFTPGMGHVTVQDYGAIVFDHTQTPADVSYLKSGNDLVISSASGTDSLRLQDWYLRNDQPEAWFTGEVRSYADLSEQGTTLIGTNASNNLIAPDNYGWHLQGLAGDDILQGNSDADSLDGGAGNDTLLGNAGSDQYYFGYGSGRDIITDQTLADSGDINSIYVDPAVLPENIVVNKDKNHIILSILGTTDKLTIQWDVHNSYLIQQVI